MRATCRATCAAALTPSASRLWLPFTQMRGFDPESRCFERGQGTMLFDRAGHAY